MIRLHNYKLAASLVSALFGVISTLGLTGCDKNSTDSHDQNNPIHYAYYVDAIAGNDSNPGTDPAPFRTITKALSVAVKGDSVKVAPGAYDAQLGESFPIELPDSVALFGDVDNYGDGPIPTEVLGPSREPGFLATWNNGQGALVAGFTIAAAEDSSDNVCVKVLDVDFTIANNTLSANRCGIDLRGPGTVMVANNRIAGAGNNVSIQGSGDFTFVNNTVDCGTGGVFIRLYLSGRAVFRGNHIIGNNSPGLFVYTGSPLLDSNFFSGTFRPLWGGIAIGSNVSTIEDTRPVVRNNTFHVETGTCMCIRNHSSVDIGTTSDPGSNLFGGPECVSIRHQTADTVFAIGNAWSNTTPVCGADIVLQDSGIVIWGDGQDEYCR